MSYALYFLPEAEKDFKNLAGNERIAVAKMLEKVKANPLPISEGSYGKPLGNKHQNKLSGFMKIKLKALGIRVVYKLVKVDERMVIVVIGARADNEVYEAASRRAKKHAL